MLSSLMPTARAGLVRFVGRLFAVVMCLLLVTLGCGRTSLEPESGGEGGGSACGPSTCPTGCCDAKGECRTGRDANACGAGGRTCSSCRTSGFDFCTSSGSCAREDDSCAAGLCEGCCSNVGGRSVCLTGTTPDACGSSSARCTECGRSQQCTANVDGGGRCLSGPACGPQNCAGCCQGSRCVTAPTDAACGVKGEACKSCDVDEACSPTGQCVDSSSRCGPQNCAGCCVGDFCATGAENTACGKAGSICQNCQNQGGSCDAGACKLPPCGPATCPSGCCSGNTCVTGTQDATCGGGGAACTNCNSTNESCQSRQCVEKCGPSNCAGCCRANNTCNVLGSDSTSCGENGVACQNCASAGSFCSGLVSPRQCNSQQTTCPASYGTCGATVRTPVTQPLQGLCSDNVLDGIALACTGGSTTGPCRAAFFAMPVGCRNCLSRFNHPFEQRTGLYACAASQVDVNCRHAMGCATQCADTSCDQCSATSETQCLSLVNGSGGQCSSFVAQTSCASAALNGGLCSQFSYGNYGAWLRSVGDAFCGNGP